MSTHTVNINGIDLVYDKEGSGPAMLFIHGSNASAVYWEAVVPHFMGDYTCYTVELRGHGRSGRSPDPTYPFSDFVDDSVKFVEEVTGPTVLVGHSLGGLVACAVAADRPELARAVYCEDIAPHAVIAADLESSPLLAFLRGLGDLTRAKERDGLTIAQHAYNIGQFAPFGTKPIDTWPPARLIFFARFAYDTDPAVFDSRTGGFSLEEAEDMCRKIRCPVHIGYGDAAAGGVVSPEIVTRTRAAGLAVTSTHFPGGPHAISPAFPREFVNDLRSFLATIP